jgi:hypothetical protein
MLKAILATIICALALMSSSHGQQLEEEQAPTAQEQISSLREELERMKTEYEERIRALEQSESAAPVHRGAPVGTYGGLMNPDVSVVVDVQALFTDDKDNDNRNKVRIKEGELALQAFLYPGVWGNFIAALEQEYDGDDVETDVDVEEAYVEFQDLPFGIQAEVGRKFMNFGRLNALHPHHWPITQTPLVLENLFGHHPWYDDGVQLSVLVPNPWDLYANTGFGVWNGRDPGHGHDHDDEQRVDWEGHVYLSRSSLDLPVTDEMNGVLGYSAAWDEGGETTLHNWDATLNYRWPMTYRRLKWRNELIYADVDERDVDSLGLYSIVQVTLDKYWETGLRYDWAESTYDDDNDEWAAGLFLTYYFTHSMYLRGEYRYTDLAHGDEENAFVIQLVWGLGPHAHRLED